MKIFSPSLILGLLFLSSCQEKQNTQQAPPPAFPVVEVPLRTVTGYTSYPASLEGIISSDVRAKVSGYITAVLVDAGKPVRKGQTLFQLETQTLIQDAGAARANVNAAQVEVDKLKPLVEKGIVSEMQLATAEARLAQAQAVLKSISANISYASIRSPIDGYVGAINFREGTLVGPADPTPLTTVSDIDKVYAFFAMNERDYLDFLQAAKGKNLTEKISNFPPVQLQLVNGQVYDHPGVIETVTGQVNPLTGTVGFRAIFPNPDRLLADGNSGVIRIPRTYENVPVVPEAATFEQQGRVYTFRVQGDTVVVSTPIQVVDRVDNLAVVASGIEAGDKIIAEGVGKLRHNAPVQPQIVPFDSVAHTLQTVFK